MRKKCLVTGGAGFIGSHLCADLIHGGYKVLCLDNLSTGRKINIDALLKNPYFKFVYCDVSKSLPTKITPDYIFHLASPASPNIESRFSYHNLALETLLVNSYGTYLLLDLAKKSGAKFLFASTSEVYGDPLIHPQREDYWGNVNPVGNRSCYDEAKRFGEAITITFVEKFKIDARIVRIFNTYGPKMHLEDGRAVITFIIQALKEKPITIFGDGNQTRSFCYVSDMVDGLKKAMFTKKTLGEVINLGNPQEISILNLAKQIKKLTNSSSKLVFSSLQDDDPIRRRPDITKAKRILNWNSTTELDDGLLKTILFYREEIKTS